MKLKLFGPHGKEEAKAALLAPYERVGDDQAQRILQYLSRGTGLIATAGPVALDPLDPEARHSSEVFTDGEWLWTSLCRLCISKYRLPVSAEFLQHLEANNYLPPPLSDDRARDICNLIATGQVELVRTT